MNIATGGYGAEGTQPTTAGTGGGLRSQTTYDLTGRVTGVTEYALDGTTVNYNRYGIVYDRRGNVTSESTSTRTGGTVNYASTTNTYAAGGVLTNQYTSGASSASYNFSYQWWDGAQQSSIVNTGTGHTSTFYYNPNGHLTSVYIGDGRPRSVTYVTDATGQILQRREADNTSNGDPKQVWWSLPPHGALPSARRQAGRHDGQQRQCRSRLRDRAERADLQLHHRAVPVRIDLWDDLLRLRHQLQRVVAGR